MDGKGWCKRKSVLHGLHDHSHVYQSQYLILTDSGHKYIVSTTVRTLALPYSDLFWTELKNAVRKCSGRAEESFVVGDAAHSLQA